MLSIPLLLGIIFAAALLWFWQNSLGTRERANFAAQGACERMGLQFLDGTVAFARISLGRTADTRLCLRRTYIFDYTAGSIERLQGFVLMLGQRVESIGFASNAHIGKTANHDPEARQPLSINSNAPPEDDKVLNLNEWRQRRLPRATPAEKHPNDAQW